MANNSKINKDQTPSKGEQHPTPVVAILGHVDHGKTSLLDFIRKSHITKKEAGGITQHIGAYQVIHHNRKITFIDTPGHEAFSAMRARGGNASDIAVLVIAADDGVMPQTKESIAHIKAANIPFIVVINKIDTPGANVERVKKQLSTEGVLVEGFGGDVVCVLLSAKTGEGVETLLEMINLVSDMAQLSDNSDKEFSAVIIEARLDKFKGNVATILVKSGHIKVGDEIFTKTSNGKIKSMKDSNGILIHTAGPSTPIEILGFNSTPKVGEVVTNKRLAELSLEKEKQNPKILIGLPKQDEIRLIIKADVAGSLEAIENALSKLKKEDQKIKIFYSDTGDITEGDVLLASATKSLIIGFGVGVNKSAEKLASEETVLIRKFSIIYELLDELKEGIDALNFVEEPDVEVGEAKVIKAFKINESKIAGAVVTSGRINISDTLIFKREGKTIGRSKILSLKHRDSTINEAAANQEFGAILEKDIPFTKGDIIVAIGS